MMLVVVWLHLLAAFVWIGGMLFLSLVVVPSLRTPALAPQRGPIFKTLGRRFRPLVWTAIAVLLTTGPILLLLRGMSLLTPDAWPTVLVLKLSLVGLLFTLTLLHDIWLGPRLGFIQQRPEEARSATDRALLRWAPWIPRLSLLIALGIAAAGLALARI